MWCIKHKATHLLQIFTGTYFNFNFLVFQPEIIATSKHIRKGRIEVTGLLLFVEEVSPWIQKSSLVLTSSFVTRWMNNHSLSSMMTYDLSRQQQPFLLSYWFGLKLKHFQQTAPIQLDWFKICGLPWPGWLTIHTESRAHQFCWIKMCGYYHLVFQVFCLLDFWLQRIPALKICPWNFIHVTITLESKHILKHRKAFSTLESFLGYDMELKTNQSIWNRLLQPYPIAPTP